jgi:hypothetical protein
MNAYSAYDYLAYVIPGGTVLIAAQLAFAGWPSSEPGNAGLVALLAAAFLLGHGTAALAALFEPLVWGHRPGAPVSPLWGLEGPRGVYDRREIESIHGELASRYGSGLGLKRLYQLAYTDLQQRGKDQRLLTLNSQIGFHRNSAAAFTVAGTLQLGAILAGRDAAGGWAALALYSIGVLVFGMRYKRYWRQFGDNVIRGFRVLAAHPVIDPGLSNDPDV